MKPRLLDLFCCEGGAATGYAEAGFDVTGVDLAPQKRYPYTFIQADAFAYLLAHGHEYDVIHASPPCQAYSVATPEHARAALPRLIAPIREALRKAGRPYIIENVAGARHELHEPVMLCGTMLDLPVWRHRYFESTIPLAAPGPCKHQGRPVTIHSGSNTRKTTGHAGIATVRAALGVPWMSKHGAYECIPPAYTRHLGAQALAYLNERQGMAA